MKRRLVTSALALVAAACSPGSAADTTTSAAEGGGAMSSSGGPESGAGGTGDPAAGAGGESSSTTGTAPGSVASSSSSGAGAGDTGGGGGAVPDACETAVPACDAVPPTSSGLGLLAIDRCGFALDRSSSFETLGPLADALADVAEPVDLATVLGDLNRAPDVVAAGDLPGDPPGVSYAFQWEPDVNDGATWIPQGITGSADASPAGTVLGRQLVAVSSYFDEDAAPDAAPKGVRLALVDVTNPVAPVYRFLLLVEPTAGPDFVPIPIHAGGIAWVGDYLYVADTFAGLRVFDMRKIYRVDTSADVIGCEGGTCRAGLYKYVLPQVGAFDRFSPCDPAPRFSYVALDRSGEVPALVTGEYCGGTSCDGPLDGRLFRYPVDPSTGLLAGGERTFAKDAYYLGERQVQGAVCAGDTCYLSSSEPAAGAGALFVASTDESRELPWIDAPEDLLLDRTTNELWSLSEGIGERFVFASDLSAID